MNTDTDYLINRESNYNKAIADMFSSGIACHIFVALNKCNIIPRLKDFKVATIDELVAPYPNANKVALRSALTALTYANLITIDNDKYSLTEQGIATLHTIGEFNLWFGAYAKTYPKLHDMFVGNYFLTLDDVDHQLVATASAEVGSQKVDHYLIKALKALNIREKICDLGCGSGRRLDSICRQLKVGGIGIDISPEAIDYAKQAYYVNDSVSKLDYYVKDVTKIEKVHDDVEVLLQTFMTHHITPEEHCASVFRSYKDHFPRAKYFLVLDTVWPEHIENKAEIFTPGFLLIHGLQRLAPRSKQNILRVFDQSGFELSQEIKLDVPNSYLWILKL